jgi:hypothetical protein
MKYNIGDLFIATKTIGLMIENDNNVYIIEWMENKRIWTKTYTEFQIDNFINFHKSMKHYPVKE